MIHKVSQVQYPDVKRVHAAAIAWYPLINAVVSSVQDGQVYADTDLAAVLVVTKSGFSLVVGVESSRYDRFLEFLVQDSGIADYVHFYDPDSAFRDAVARSGKRHWIRRRAQFRSRASVEADDPLAALPAGYSLVRVADIAYDQLDRAFGLELGQRYWNSPEDLAAHAFGASIVDDRGLPIAIFYSACVVDGVAEGEMFVREEYRGNQFGRYVAASFLRYARARSLVTHWDTFVSNVPSYKMAQRLALEEVRQYDLMSVLLR